MSDLIVIGFDSQDEATAALTECKKLEKEYLLDLEDAVVVVRGADGKLHLQQSINLEKVGASYGLFSGGFWGALVGLLCLNPLAGFVAGSIVGLAPGRLRARCPITALMTISSSRSARPFPPIRLPCSCWCASRSPTRFWLT